MKKNLFFVTVGLIFWLCPLLSSAYKDNTFSLGLGYFSENFMSKTSQKPDGSSSLLGEPSYPLYAKYDFSLSSDWFIAPQLIYSLMPRKAPGDSAKILTTHLLFQFGKNLKSSQVDWDWYVGPGYLVQEIKGSGGTAQLNNGTGTATFAVPGGDSTIRKVTICTGGSISVNHSRFGLDLIFLNFMSNAKRTQNLVLSYSYQFGGGF